MTRINVKPLSVNEVWQGKRFKTKKYRQYEKEVLLILKPQRVTASRLSVSLVFGISSKNADIDNPIKPLLDILQKKYQFNDRQIYELNVKKVDVPKGDEFIDFTISEIN